MNPLEVYYRLTTPIPIDGLRDANGVVVNFLGWPFLGEVVTNETGTFVVRLTNRYGYFIPAPDTWQENGAQLLENLLADPYIP